MLKPVQKLTEEPEYGSDSPIVECENPSCRKQGPSHKMINLCIIIGSPGHEDLPPFQCPAKQAHNALGHWACSPDCWRIVAHACVDEHMHMLLSDVHQNRSYDGTR